MNRKSWIPLVVLTNLSLLVACRRPALESLPARQPIVIDGDDADWKAVPSQRFEKWNVAFGICNTAEDLHFSMVFLDPRLAMMAGTRGLMLEFRNPDSEESIFDLHYTGIDTFGSALEPGDSFWESLTPDQKKRFQERRVSDMNTITITRQGQSIRIPPDGSFGIAAARLDTKGFHGFEWRIPIRQDGNDTYSLGLDPGRTVLVGIRLGDQKREDTPGMTVPGGSKMGERGMMGNLPMPGSGRTASPESPFGQKHVWFTLTLSGIQ